MSRGVLAFVAHDGRVQLLDLKSLEPLTDQLVTAPATKDLDLTFSGDGKLMVFVTSAGRQVQVIETRAWSSVAEWRSDKAPLLSVQASPDGTMLASCGDQLRIWKLSTGDLLHACKAHRQPTDRVAFSADGRLLATVSQDGSAKVWEVGTWRELAELRGHLLGVHCLAFSPNSQRLATGSAVQDAVKLWDLRTFREVFNLSLPGKYVRALGFSPDGNTLCAFAEDDYQFQNYLWRVPASTEIGPREPYPEL